MTSESSTSLLAWATLSHTLERHRCVADQGAVEKAPVRTGTKPQQGCLRGAHAAVFTRSQVKVPLTQVTLCSRPTMD